MGNKTNYIVHSRNLQLYLSLEMKLTKMHRALIFNSLTGWKTISILTLKKEEKATNKFEMKLFQINDEFCLWENNGKLEKKNLC